MYIPRPTNGGNVRLSPVFFLLLSACSYLPGWYNGSSPNYADQTWRLASTYGEGASFQLGSHTCLVRSAAGEVGDEQDVDPVVQSAIQRAKESLPGASVASTQWNTWRNEEGVYLGRAHALVCL